MHHCLHNTDLVSIIIDQLDRDKAALVRLARVCTSFKELALDALYYKIAFDDLLGVLPKDLMEPQPEDKEPEWNTMNFQRTMTQDEWCVLISYAARVRRLDVAFVEHPDPENADRNICEVLARNCPVPSLFPSLVELSMWLKYVESAPRFVHGICLSPKIRTLVAKQFLAETLLEDLYRMGHPLSSRCPLLETFVCGPNSPIMEVANPSSIVTNTVCAWPNLRVLDCGPLGPRSISHVASMPSFKALRLVLSEETTWPDEAHLFGLNTLETLNIDCSDLCSYGKLSNVVSSLFGLKHQAHPPQATLRRIEVVATTTSPSSLSAFATALASHISHSALQEVICNENSFRRRGHGRGVEVAERDISAWFRVLRPFQQLTHIELRCVNPPQGDGIPIQANTLLECARSWPRLRSLTLWLLVTPLKLEETIDLLQILPHLEIFDVGTLVTSESIGSVCESTSPLPSNSRIDALTFDHATEDMQDADSLASLLAQIVPQVSTVYSVEHLPYTRWPKRSPFWSTVLRKVRGQEASSDTEYPDHFDPSFQAQQL
ncbi:hypothetical protein CONPUDRAFT_163749 [Coniophora puteana RWD-64-598 SS2]|uniref:F-box domain-containing protein n=1 Tax=Coniophora puteana (strain RWD-64-598) TaxID=741705 RepID=A0A5M3MVM7_CONPW|nr:uncharacterized protein CONPUDRAFT_163749 [Coniophora puteana RWD-64-598 SS2]EIW82641.1 hypothetical protein CONPUDRAFT_163749 [Coniophora puteana RWD-64-598 SS2]